MSETFFAVCPRGVEPLLAEELHTIGASGVAAAAGGARFSGTLATAYAVNLHSRLASRVLWCVAQGGYRDEADLYDLAHQVPWEREFSPEQTLRVDVTAHRSPLRSLHFATLRVKDAIVDRARERSGSRPSIDRHCPDIQVLAHLTDQQAQIYLDLSGESLFKRGWRADKGEAPIKENLAAALLQIAGWPPTGTHTGETTGTTPGTTPGATPHPLLDPFCGSGTIAIEAACLATRRAPGLQRRFAFETLRSFDRDGWVRLRQEAQDRIDDGASLQIVGRDISTRVIATAEANARRAGLGSLLDRGVLRFEAQDARSGAAIAPSGWIVTNPPYGEQSNPKSASVPALMNDVAAQWKRHFAGWQAWMLSSDRDLPRQMRLRESRKTVLYNGPLECRFFRFEMVAGSMRG